MMTARKVCARLQDSETMVTFTNVLSGTSALIGKAARQFKKSEWQRLMPGEAFALRWDHQTNMATPHPTAMTVASVQRAYEIRASMLAVCLASLKSRAKVKGRFESSTTDADAPQQNAASSGRANPQSKCLRLLALLLDGFGAAI